MMTTRTGSRDHPLADPLAQNADQATASLRRLSDRLEPLLARRL